MTEEKLTETANAITSQIKIALFKKNMKQTELAQLIDENPQQISRAIHGDMQPKSIEIRRKIYRVLDIA
ncbi:hypothetical protein FC83_GL000941 [Agrilactobacillus composti DSM 18527 = JCM 14202]|uniref:HTH cro/C1-type domain-containing protein n=1 Tax=Agrilactobacillus composti DSM 18527 = JCM 14202 TaxID=1423734 RepID=X0QRB0_9LACO|nr:transcriptional regulator [Agrilactobacillus composti]KRM35636.1 hypothetical protein FC83_GL000941 [Agrilactobacillus composti DSM 18527 = JCM 14202]GAF41155.1 hypothetical protein JCM14202_3081 [Agrilactobacillus composti DSM 18527 = JCM 14202]